MKLKIPNYSNYYLETEDNGVYNKHDKKLKEYLNVDEEKNRKVVEYNLKNDNGQYKNVKKHRLVYTAYHPEEDISKLQINHLDEDTLNNDISNLRSCTCKENINWGTGNVRRSEAMKGKPNSSVAIEVKATVVETGKVEYYLSVAEAARTLGVCVNSIWCAINGISKTSVGRVWERYYGG